MSQEPPIPAGNQSPFPFKEAPHHHAGPPPGAEVARSPDRSPAIPKGALIGGLVAASVAVLVGAWAYATEPKNKRKERKRRKAR